jgi:pimeloyl-ACP methyl ester carboxylesterase
MPFFQHDGLRFFYQDQGEGIPFVFQHGLGGDTGQPFGLFQPPPGFRMLAFDFRGHGETRPLGNSDKIRIASFSDDLQTFLDYLKLTRAIIGGISLGAAVALNFAVRFQERVLGLVLSRPAWLDAPRDENVSIYRFIAQLIWDHGPQRGREIFVKSEAYRAIREQSPDAAASLARQFESPRALDAVVRLERIPQDAPIRSLHQAEEVAVPTLVLANDQDPIHPLDYGKELAHIMPRAEFQELTPKSVSPECHQADVQRFVSDFFLRNFRKG